MKFYPHQKIIVSFLLSAIFFSACNESPVACLYTNTGKLTVKVDKPISIVSCGRNIDAYEWNASDDAKITGGGGFCDKSVTVKYKTKGEKVVRVIAHKFKKKSKSSCQEMGNDSKKDEANIVITVE